MKKINSFLNSPLWKIIKDIFSVVGVLVTIVGLFWGSGKIIQFFSNNTLFQSPVVTGSPNSIFNYDNSVTNNHSSIITVDPEKPEDGILRAIAKKFDCNWKKIEGSENQYVWECHTPSFTIENKDNFPKENIRLNLPDGRKFFIPFIAAKDIVSLGVCTKGEEYPDCKIHSFYSIENHLSRDICIDIFFKWNKSSVVPEIEKSISLECKKK